jgi:hypothetical protein
VEGEPPVILHRPAEDAAEREQLEAGLKRQSATWIEFELVGDRDSLRWFEPAIEPWEEFTRPQVRWSDVGEVLALFGITGPDLGNGDARTETLRVLPLVYTLGVRRARAELRTQGQGVCLFPVIGFDEPASERLRSWMFRVNVAAVGDLVFTLRLPERLWPRDSSRDLPPAASTLVVRERYVPSAGQPSALELAEAIAIHQAATCGAIVARARSWLGDIERRFMQRTPVAADADKGPEDKSASADPMVLGENFHQLFRLGVRAEELQRESPGWSRGSTASMLESRPN